MRVLVLLSPAKTLNWATPPASLSAVWSQPKLLKEADAVIEVMRGKKKVDLKKLMSVSDSIADLNVERFKNFLPSSKVAEGPPAAEMAADYARPAALAYDGPAYRGMDAATFSEEDWIFGAGSVRLLSGLYGVLRPSDLIQPYRLEMGSRVGVDGKKDLYDYWKEDIARCLLQDVRGKDCKGGGAGRFLVVNVASQEYSKAVDFGQLESAGGMVVTCVFKDDGRVLSVFAKRARGLFARHIVISRAKDIADLESFSAEGYCLDRSQSSDGLLVFARSKAQRLGPTKSPAGAKSPASVQAKSEAKPKAESKGKTRKKIQDKKKTNRTTSTTGRVENQITPASRTGKKSAVGASSAATARGKRASPAGSEGGSKAKVKRT